MNRNYSQTNSRKQEARGHYDTQSRIRQQNLIERQEDFGWIDNIENVLSPYWAARTGYRGPDVSGEVKIKA